MLENPFLAGALTGLFQNAFAHPLDTVKTYIQNNPKHKINFREIKYFNGILFSSKISVITTSITFGVNYTQKDENNYKTGMIAGIFNSITNPLEIQKVQRQNNQIIKLPIYRGFGATFLRETTANSIYFGSYNDLKNKVGIFQAGGIAGVSCWLLTYPIDVIKSRVQSNNMSYLEAYKAGNIWKGLSYCLIRAYIGNAIGFSIYEVINKTNS